MGVNAESGAAPAWTPWGPEDAAEWIAVPRPGDDKYTRGVLGVVTGSDRYPGAAVLSVDAAVRAGVGMVRYLGGPRAETLVLQRRPEVVPGPGRVQAWLVGCGIDRQGRSRETTEAILRAFEDRVPVVADSGALDLIDRIGGPAVITPHYRELSFVLGRAGVAASPEEIAAEPGSWAQRATDALGLTVLLKGHTSYVASPGGVRSTVSLGPSWLATAGTGDVLAGVLGAFAATNAGAVDRDAEALAALAASAAAVHGLAASAASAGGPLAALDVAESLPRTIAGLVSSRVS